jgi:hypothetical protein
LLGRKDRDASRKSSILSLVAEMGAFSVFRCHGL